MAFDSGALAKTRAFGMTPEKIEPPDFSECTITQRGERLTHLNFGAYHLRLAFTSGRLSGPPQF
jgi:hypothetical protein